MAGPTLADLRRAGAEAHIARLRHQLDAAMCRTWRGRLAWTLASWIARRRRQHI